MRIKSSSERKLDTDEKTTFADLSEDATLKSKKIINNEAKHRLKKLN